MEKSRLSAAFPSLGLGLLTDPLGTTGGRGRRGRSVLRACLPGYLPTLPLKNTEVSLSSKFRVSRHSNRLEGGG